MKLYTNILLLFFAYALNAQSGLDTIFPVRGLCIAAPKKSHVDSFVTFIRQELAPARVNTLILRVDYEYEYQSHPELRNNNPLSKADVKKLVAVCKNNNIKLIPQINLLGHQSWASTLEKLLQVYPQFDETPHVKMPEKYEWPNADGLYCKSYCPLHDSVHMVVFSLVDEICDVFESDGFHAGMDEVFYIGDDKCPRCAGRDKAELFAGEVNKINQHLRQKNRKLYIWGDRLIDGKTTGIGMWEASMNHTHRAIDMIDKSVIICDWHYEAPLHTAVYFAMKGFDVITCPWRTPSIAVQQTKDMITFRSGATKVMKNRYQGMMQTVWSGAESFMREYYAKKEGNTSANCFRAMFAEMHKTSTVSK
ncbi:MAG: family 20 glycosylhydrolase [Saprospiraceae bacterium]|nr:family 20 glycosylhydrolase [Saprospiraceae bacterium]